MKALHVPAHAGVAAVARDTAGREVLDECWALLAIGDPSLAQRLADCGRGAVVIPLLVRDRGSPGSGNDTSDEAPLESDTPAHRVAAAV